MKLSLPIASLPVAQAPLRQSPASFSPSQPALSENLQRSGRGLNTKNLNRKVAKELSKINLGKMTPEERQAFLSKVLNLSLQMGGITTPYFKRISEKLRILSLKK
jgi:hypothetical protein